MIFFNLKCQIHKNNAWERLNLPIYEKSTKKMKNMTVFG